MSIILLIPYIAEYHNILQCITIRLSVQSKYASVILKFFSTITHNTHVDDIKHHSNILHNAKLAIIIMFFGNNCNTVFQYYPTIICRYFVI